MPSTSRRDQRTAIACALAHNYGGVVTRRMLIKAGVTKKDIETEIAVGRWRAAGRHTVVILGSPLPAWTASPRGSASDRPLLFAPTRSAMTARVGLDATAVACFWWALWETGGRGVLDGSSSLLVHGLTGFVPSVIDLSIPPGAYFTVLEGVRVSRRRDSGEFAARGIPRTVPEVATIRAAQLAASDRQAALLLCMSVQQRLVRPAELLDQWRTIRRSPRRSLMSSVILDVCDGAHSLGELDFAGMCRAARLPEPRRQQLVRRRNGSYFLDAEFPGGLVVEIDGFQHFVGMAPIEDALRANDITLRSRRVLRIPVIGLRTDGPAFMAQLRRALAT